MNQDLNDMMVFLAVVEAGGFTAAAERLSMPKANVSRKVSKLERQLGVTLLERSTRSQHLTEAGKHYLHHCKRIQEELNLAEVAVSEVLHSYRGNLKVGASVTIGQQILKPIIAKFLQQYPDVNLQLNLVNHRVDLIEEGFDLLVRVGKLDDSRLIAKRLGDVQRHIYASPKYIKRLSIDGKKIGSNIEQIAELDVLLMDRLAVFNKVEFECGKKSKVVQLNPRLVVDDFAIVKQVTMDGGGLAILPSYMCVDELRNGKLIKLFPDWGMPPIDVFVLYPQQRIKIPKVKAFVEFVDASFQACVVS